MLAPDEKQLAVRTYLSTVHVLSILQDPEKAMKITNNHN